MAIKKFGASQREALWLAYGKKCAYSGQLLDIGNFHIDHIIPESSANNLNGFEELKLRLGLRRDFDINGYENLLPCTAVVNLQKGAAIFEDASLRYFLALADSRKAKVHEYIDKIERRNNKGKVIVALQQLFESGDLSMEDVSEIISKYDDRSKNVFRLLQDLNFADGSTIRTIADEEINDLYSKPIKLGQNCHIDNITLSNSSHDHVYVKTCKEYDEAIRSGYYAATTFDIKMSTFFNHQCGLLRLLQHAVNPESSFVADPKVGIMDLHLIPFSFFPSLGESPREEDSVVTYQDKVADGTIIVKRLRQNYLCVEEPEGMGQQLVEYARADFNGDGVEDIMIAEYCYATHGTLGYGNVQVLTRRSSSSLFEVML